MRRTAAGLCCHPAPVAWWLWFLHLQVRFGSLSAEWTPALQAEPEEAEDQALLSAERRASSGSIDVMLEKPWVPAGLWMPAEATAGAKSRVLRCFDLDVCPGGPPGTCAQGRAGVACADCEGTGDSSMRSAVRLRPLPYSGTCESCDVCCLVWFIVFEVVLIFLALSWSTLYKLGSDDIEKKTTIQDRPDAIAHTSRGQLAAILHVALPAVQLVALSVAEARALAPKSVSIFGGFLQGLLDLFTFDARPLRPACVILSLGGSAAPSDALVVSTAIPMLWLLGVALLLAFGKLQRSCGCDRLEDSANGTDATHGFMRRTLANWLRKSPIIGEAVGVEEIMAAVVIFVYSFSVALVRLSLRFVDCVHHPGGLETSPLHPGMDCPTEGHGLPLQVGFGILLLLGGYLILLKGRSSGMHGSLFWLQIQADFWWWPLAATTRNAAAAVAASHVGHSPLGGHMGLIVVQAWYCVATACCSPWCSTALNRLDTTTSALGSLLATALAAAALGAAPMTEAISSPGDVKAASYTAVILFASLLLVLLCSTCAMRWILPDLREMRERDRGYRLRVAQWIMQQSLYLCSAEPRIYRMIINSLSRKETEEVAKSISIVYEQLRQDPENGYRVNQERWAALQSISEEWVLKLADPARAENEKVPESRRNSQDLSNTGWGPFSLAPSMAPSMAPSRSVSQAPSALSSRRSSVSLVSMRDLLGYQGSRRSSFAGKPAGEAPMADTRHGSDRPSRSSKGPNSRRSSFARLSRRNSKFSQSRRVSGVGIASETGDLLSLRKTEEASPDNQEKDDDEQSVIMDVKVSDIKEQCGRHSLVEMKPSISSSQGHRKSVSWQMEPMEFSDQKLVSDDSPFVKQKSDGSADVDIEDEYADVVTDFHNRGSNDLIVASQGPRSPEGSWNLSGTFKTALGKLFGTKTTAEQEQEWKEKTWSPCASADASATGLAYRKHFQAIVNSSGAAIISTPEKTPSPEKSPTNSNKEFAKTASLLSDQQTENDQQPQEDHAHPKPPAKYNPEPPEAKPPEVSDVQAAWTILSPEQPENEKESNTVETTTVLDIERADSERSSEALRVAEVTDADGPDASPVTDDAKARWKARKEKRKAAKPAGFFFSQDSFASNMGFDDEAAASAAFSKALPPRHCVGSAPVSTRGSLVPPGADVDDRPHWYRATEIFKAQRANENQALQKIEAKLLDIKAKEKEASMGDEELTVSEAEKAKIEAKKKWEARRAAKKAAKEATAAGGGEGQDYRAYLLKQSPQSPCNSAPPQPQQPSESEAPGAQASSQEGGTAAPAAEAQQPATAAPAAPESEEDAALRRLAEKFQAVMAGKTDDEPEEQSPEAVSKYQERKARRKQAQDAAKQAQKSGDTSAVSKGYGAWIMATYTSNQDGGAGGLPGQPNRDSSRPATADCGIGEGTAMSQLFGGIGGALARQRREEADSRPGSNEFGGDVNKQRSLNDPKEWKSWMRSSSTMLHNRYKKRDEKRQKGDGSASSMSASVSSDEESEPFAACRSELVLGSSQRPDLMKAISDAPLRNTTRTQTMPSALEEASIHKPGSTPPPLNPLSRDDGEEEQLGDTSFSPSDEETEAARQAFGRPGKSFTDDNVPRPGAGAADSAAVRNEKIKLLRRSLTTQLEYLQEESTAPAQPPFESQGSGHTGDGIANSDDLPSGQPLQPDASIDVSSEKLQQMALLRRSLTNTLQEHRGGEDRLMPYSNLGFGDYPAHSGLSTVHESGANSMIGSQRPSALVTASQRPSALMGSSGMGSGSSSAGSRDSASAVKGGFLGRLGRGVGSMINRWRNRQEQSGLSMIPDITLQQLASVNPEIQNSPLYRGEMAKRHSQPQAVMEEDESGERSDSLRDKGNSENGTASSQDDSGNTVEEPSSPKETSAAAEGINLRRSISMKSVGSQKSRTSILQPNRTWSMKASSLAEAASAIADVVSGKRRSADKGRGSGSARPGRRASADDAGDDDNHGPNVTSIFSDPPPLSRTGSFAVTKSMGALLKKQNSDNFAEFGRQLTNASSSNRPAVAPGDWLVAPNSVLRLVTSQAYGGVLGGPTNFPTNPGMGMGETLHMDGLMQQQLPENPHAVSLHPELLDKRYSGALQADDSRSHGGHSGSDTSEARSEATAVLLSKARAGMDSDIDVDRSSQSSATLNISRVLSGDSIRAIESMRGSSEVMSFDQHSPTAASRESAPLHEEKYDSSSRAKVMTTPDPLQFKSDHSDSNSSTGNSSIASSVGSRASRARRQFSPLTNRELNLRASDCSMRMKVKEQNSSDSGTDSETVPQRRAWRTKTT